MSVLIGLRAYLVAQAGVTALTSERIRATQADDSDTLPYVILREISNNPVYHLLGEAGITQTRVQIDAVGATPESAIAVAAAIRAELSGFRGTMGTLPVRRCHKANSNGPDFSGLDKGAQHGKYRIRTDYMIDFNE